MDTTKERFREMLNDIAERYGIKTFKQLAEMSGISQNTFTRIKRNEVKEVDIETFRKLNAAFDNRYNVLWFHGKLIYDNGSKNIQWRNEEKTVWSANIDWKAEQLHVNQWTLPYTIHTNKFKMV